MENITSYIPEQAGFYKKLSDRNNMFATCSFADSKQITADRYELQHDLYYRVKDGNIFIIKQGFTHDGASKGFLKHFGKYTNSAILHDALYAVNHNRSRSDTLFDESMEASGVSWLRRNTYWAGVRLFGWKAFNEKTQESIKKNKLFIQILGEK